MVSCVQPQHARHGCSRLTGRLWAFGVVFWRALFWLGVWHDHPPLYYTHAGLFEFVSVCLCQSVSGRPWLLGD